MKVPKPFLNIFLLKLFLHNITGSVGQEFFIILKGSVSIYKNQMIEMEQEDLSEASSPTIEDPKTPLRSPLRKKMRRVKTTINNKEKYNIKFNLTNSYMYIKH